MNHVSIRVEETHKVAKALIPKSIPSYADNISQPLFKMDSILKKNEESFLNGSSSTNSHFRKIISEQIKELEASSKGKTKTCLDKTFLNQVLGISSEE